VEIDPARYLREVVAAHPRERIAAVVFDVGGLASSGAVPDRSGMTALGAAADQNLWVDTRAAGHMLSAAQGLNHFVSAARAAAAEIIVLDPLYSTHDQDENDTRAMAALCQSLLRLRDVVARTGFNKVMCFRILYTLHTCGFLEKVGENQYRILSNVRPNRRYRIGYAAEGQDSSFPREVAAGLARAAESARVELVMVDNRYDARIALRNAEALPIIDRQNVNDEIRLNTRAYNAALERLVLRHPEQWFWVHRRWKVLRSR
jgi:hypothetical protein